jgi:protease secretion system outer membrane protein
LTDAFRLAAQNDATFRAAGFELDGLRENVPQARAALLPSVAFNASSAEVEGWRKGRNQLNQDTRVRLDYTAPQASLQLRLPILNREAAARVEFAELQVNAAEAGYAGSGMDLAERLLVAYMTVLLLEESIAQNKEQLAALERQAAQAKGRLDRGEGTRLDVARTAAELDFVRARALDLGLQLRIGRRELQRLTGVEIAAVRGIRATLQADSLAPDDLSTWLELADRMNPSIQQRTHLLAAARANVHRNRAGHLPRLDLVASVGQSQNESVSNVGQTNTLKTLALQLSVPIFNGGATQAAVRQSLSEVARAEEQLRAQRETVAIEVQRQHQALTAGLARLQAQAQLVASSELAFQASQRALSVGMATAADVADALSRLATARRDELQTRIELVLARARLLLQAGTPMLEAVQEIDRLMLSVEAPRDEMSRVQRSAAVLSPLE